MSAGAVSTYDCHVFAILASYCGECSFANFLLSSSLLTICDAQWSRVDTAAPPGSQQEFICSGKVPITHDVVNMHMHLIEELLKSSSVCKLSDGCIPIHIIVSDTQTMLQHRS